MGFLQKLLTNSVNLTKQVGSAIGDAASKTGVDAKNAFDITKLEMEIKTIDNECEKIYVSIGRKYVETLIATTATDRPSTAINVKSEINTILPLLKRKEDLQRQIDEIEQMDQQSSAMSDYNDAQIEYLNQKKKLDKALRRGIITEDEYEEMLEQCQLKLDNFEKIQNVNEKYRMGIINEAERKSRLRALGVDPD